jgi:uncharacterized membrane protein
MVRKHRKLDAYPKARIEAFGDGIFAVAMTLLVLDVRLPDDFHPADGAELLHGIAALFPKFLPFALSFWVLGLRWLALVRLKSAGESYGSGYGAWWLLYLFFVTCTPFTTMIVGRYIQFAPAIWLYAGNTALLGSISLILLLRTPGAEHLSDFRPRIISVAILLASSLLAIGWSFFSPSRALFALTLNLLSGLARPRPGPTLPSDHVQEYSK